MKSIVFAAYALMVTTTISACGGGQSEKSASAPADTAPLPPPPPALPDVLARLNEVDSLKTFADAVAQAALISAPGKTFTVFAPVNRSLSAAKGWNDKNVLALHVVEGKLFSDDVMTQKSLVTLSGKEVKVELDGKSLKINGSRIVESDIKADNGVIHVLDSPIKP